MVVIAEEIHQVRLATLVAGAAIRRIEIAMADLTPTRTMEMGTLIALTVLVLPLDHVVDIVVAVMTICRTTVAMDADPPIPRSPELVVDRLRTHHSVRAPRQTLVEAVVIVVDEEVEEDPFLVYRPIPLSLPVVVDAVAVTPATLLEAVGMDLIHLRQKVLALRIEFQRHRAAGRARIPLVVATNASGPEIQQQERPTLVPNVLSQTSVSLDCRFLNFRGSGRLLSTRSLRLLLVL